jgi:nitrite reductase (NADH) small subunit
MTFDTNHSPQMQCKTGLIRIGVRADLPVSGAVKEFAVSGRFVCVANVDGDICAMDNTCPHWGGPLGQGKIQGGKLVCPWHGWTFDPRTGETPRRANIRLPIHKVIIEGDEVFMEFQDASPAR